MRKGREEISLIKKFVEIHENSKLGLISVS